MNTVKVKPWGQEQGEFVLINESDYDAEKHELFDAPEGAKKATVAELRDALTAKGIQIPEGAKKATVAELRDALTAKGIQIPEGAKKADLQAMLDAAG